MNATNGRNMLLYSSSPRACFFSQPHGLIRTCTGLNFSLDRVAVFFRATAAWGPLAIVRSTIPERKKPPNYCALMPTHRFPLQGERMSLEAHAGFKVSALDDAKSATPFYLVQVTL